MSVPDIVSVIGEHVQLRKSGQHFIGLCPFHSEKSPSFAVHPIKQIYSCFGCGVGGDVSKFLKQISVVQAGRLQPSPAMRRRRASRKLLLSPWERDWMIQVAESCPALESTKELRVRNLEIFRAFLSGKRQVDIARRFSLSKNRIPQICHKWLRRVSRERIENFIVQ